MAASSASRTWSSSDAGHRGEQVEIELAADHRREGQDPAGASAPRWATRRRTTSRAVTGSPTSRRSDVGAHRPAALRLMAPVSTRCRRVSVAKNGLPSVSARSRSRRSRPSSSSSCPAVARAAPGARRRRDRRGRGAPRRARGRATSACPEATHWSRGRCRGRSRARATWSAAPRSTKYLSSNERGPVGPVKVVEDEDQRCAPPRRGRGGRRPRRTGGTARSRDRCRGGPGDRPGRRARGRSAPARRRASRRARGATRAARGAHR